MAGKTPEQRIFRGKHRSHFCIVPNAVVEHAKLSIEAKGLHVYVLSRPPNWHIRPKQLGAKLRIGRDRLQRIMRELIDEGFWERKQVRCDGTFGAMNYYVHDVAIVPQPEKPLTAEPATAEPATAFQAAYKERNVIKEQKNKISSTSERSQHPSNRSEQAARPIGLGNGRARTDNPSAAQARLANRFGFGDIAAGWMLLGEMSEAELARLTRLEVAGKLDNATIGEVIIRITTRARAS